MNALFASDNVTSACPEVMDAVIEANSGISESYGEDEWSSRLKEKLSEVFETNVEVFLNLSVNVEGTKHRFVTVSSENRLGWTLKRKNTATLFKIGIPMFFLTFLVYYSVFLGFDKSGESIGILTTTFLSAIALYFSS